MSFGGSSEDALRDRLKALKDEGTTPRASEIELQARLKTLRGHDRAQGVTEEELASRLQSLSSKANVSEGELRARFQQLDSSVAVDGTHFNKPMSAMDDIDLAELLDSDEENLLLAQDVPQQQQPSSAAATAATLSQDSDVTNLMAQTQDAVRLASKYNGKSNCSSCTTDASMAGGFGWRNIF